MTAVRSSSYATAERFLQTVVVVDDNAYVLAGAEEVGPATLGGESIQWDDEMTDPDLDQEQSSPPDSEDFDTEVVVDGFADLGMHCAVLAPGPSDLPQDAERLLKLATRADVVILDWVIRSASRLEPGSKESDASERTTLSLLLAVLRKDRQTGGRVRLVCMYTGQGDTDSILQELESSLRREFTEVEVDHTRLVIDLGASRVVLLRKPRRVPIPGASTVSAAELPSRVVKEFGEFAADGLLPEIALESLSAVRDQAHKLLRRFNRDLDPALISHRSATSPGVAEQFATALIGDELSAIVASSDTVDALADARVEAYVESRLEGRDSFPYWRSRGSKESMLSHSEATAVLTKGIDESGKIQGTDRNFDAKISRSALLLSGESVTVREAAYGIDLRFSALSSLSRDRWFDREHSTAPELSLGALVSSLSSKADVSAEGETIAVPTYWLCMQPLCDGVRLKGVTQFPLLPLKVSKTEDSFDFVVSDGDHYATLEPSGLKLREIALPAFEPDLDRETVVASWSDGSWSFSDADGVAYQWLGHLRADKAHKVLHAVVTTAGRIGIDEYEYLRNASSQR